MPAPSSRPGLGAKLRGTVALAAAVACLVGGSALLVAGRMHSASEAFVDDAVRPGAALALVHQAEIKSRLDLYRIATAADPEARQGYVASSADDDKDVADGEAQFAPHAIGPLTAPYAAFSAGWKAWTDYRDATVLPVAQRGDVAGVRTLMDGQGNDLIGSAVDGLDATEVALAGLVKTRAAAQTSSFSSGRTIVLLALLLGLAAVGVLVELLVRSVLRRLRAVQEVAVALGAGDLRSRVPAPGDDEIGTLGAALNQASESVSQALQGLGRSARELGSSSDQLGTLSAGMASNADQAAGRADVVSAAAEQVSRNVQTVATGAEQMGASIREIAQNATDAARVAGEAVQAAQLTNDAVTKLGVSSQEIGNVVKVITSIAQQTNLLALNATIEAARAGEAGKGFAVVAHEFKDLAQETAKATDDISARITAIQTDTAGAVEAIEQISLVIAKINDYQNTIAAAVEEQTATTREMSRSVSEAAIGTSEIAENITGVAQAAAATSSGVADSQRSVAELSRMSADMGALVSRFQV